MVNLLRKWTLLLALLVIVVSASRSNAATVYGYGNNSCGTWIKEHEKKSETSRYQEVWVLGFISGTGVVLQAIDKQQKLTDADAALAYIDKHCRENPLDNLQAASQYLLSELLPK
ncbi:hypothetical protein U3G80_003423 [Vibrio cholerae]|nr:hypothetical protein [Vibrio cholerae]EKF9846807.1 hypothetical protein [Vibrio cholerae]EMC2458464.1 hypothetical protein [Vibrio cholerae]HCJ7274088.1 hypothetical protein [Vibrio cholerae]HCJ7281316.1 hypothetical protein [Vibrio cholerae]